MIFNFVNIFYHEKPQNGGILWLFVVKIFAKLKNLIDSLDTSDIDRKCQTYLKVSLTTISWARMIYFHVCHLIYDLQCFSLYGYQRFLNYVAYIWYVEGCKFSTSTHINYQIV